MLKPEAHERTYLTVRLPLRFRDSRRVRTGAATDNLSIQTDTGNNRGELPGVADGPSDGWLPCRYDALTCPQERYHILC